MGETLKERVRHIKRGSTYEVVAHAKVQTDRPLTDYAEVTVYRGESDGMVWVRPIDEFNDPDRFEDLPPKDQGTRAGDLIPRDEITPQMAAEVLLNSFGDYMPDAPKIAAVKEHTLHHGKCRPATVVAGIRAALTAIKESKDD